MGSASKKKTTARKRDRPFLEEIAVSAPVRSWTNEVAAVILFAGGVFLLLSFLSYEISRVDRGLPGDLTSWRQLRDLMGPIGRVTGTVLSGLTGWCGLVPVAWALWLARYFWRTEAEEILPELKTRVMGIPGLLGLLLFSCTLASIFFGRSGGGSIGLLMAEPLVQYVNRGGAALIAGALLLVSLALATQISISSLVSVMASAGGAALRFAFVRVPLESAKALGRFGRVCAPLLTYKRGERAADARSIPEEREKPARPKKERAEPRILEPVEIEDAGNDDASMPEPLSERDYSEIIVSRRQEAQQAKESKEKRAAKARKPEPIEEPEDDQPFADYQPPAVNLLAKAESKATNDDDGELLEKSRLIEMKLRDFNIVGKVTHVHPGPVITLYEFEPAPGVRVSKIAALQDDLGMSLKASSIRIIAPLPKRGTVGIEVPNKNREIVRLRTLLESEAFRTAESSLTIPIGADTYGEPVVADVATMPHLLMAGATGTGKSVCINTILLSMLYRASPAELGLILIDPKILELSVYEGIPHLKVPVVTSPKQAKAVLDWAVKEMERRYRMMQKFGVRNIDSYNRIARGEKDPDSDGSGEVGEGTIELKASQIVPEAGLDRADPGFDGPERSIAAEVLKPLPKIVIVIDELADLMLQVGREIEELITRLAQKARASGIHLIVATQRPSVDVITGLIKANFPARLSFRVTQRVDSRTILDSMGAEKLLGRGDMLFMLPGAVPLKRIHGAFVSDAEVKRVVTAIKEQWQPCYDENIMQVCERALLEESGGSASCEGEDLGEGDYDAFYDKAVELVVEKRQASTSMIQRAFRIGYNRAARIIDMMEREGVVGPMDGVKPREVLVPAPEAR